MAELSIAGLLHVIILIIYIPLFVIALVSYVLTAIGVHRLNVRKKLKHPWLAWIPYINTYAYARLIGDRLTIRGKEIKNFPVIYFLIIFSSTLITVFVSVFGLFAISLENLFTLGVLSMTDDVGLGMSAGWASLLILIANLFLQIINLIITLALWVVTIYVAYRFFYMFDEKNALLYAFLTLILFAFPILVFFMRNRTFTDYEGRVTQGAPAKA